MNDQSDETIEIPYGELSPAALRGILEAYVLREGTEYGERDHSLDEKVAAVHGQLERGEVRIVFSPRMNGVELVTTHQWHSQNSSTT